MARVQRLRGAGRRPPSVGHHLRDSLCYHRQRVDDAGQAQERCVRSDAAAPPLGAPHPPQRHRNPLVPGAVSGDGPGRRAALLHRNRRPRRRAERGGDRGAHGAHAVPAPCARAHHPHHPLRPRGVHVDDVGQHGGGVHAGVQPHLLLPLLPPHLPRYLDVPGDLSLQVRCPDDYRPATAQGRMIGTPRELLGIGPPQEIFGTARLRASCASRLCIIKDGETILETLNVIGLQREREWSD
mmetsp:Transcript_46810/g.111460  ORF Transcript_46810/g.111460 Transcript_46810/m.111460 type:complete len:240 (+) Transcript_46810:664-1383(+)